MRVLTTRNTWLYSEEECLHKMRKDCFLRYYCFMSIRPYPGFPMRGEYQKSITVIEVEIKRIYGLGGGFRLCASVLHQGGVNGEFVD